MQNNQIDKRQNILCGLVYDLRLQIKLKEPQYALIT